MTIGDRSDHLMHHLRDRAEAVGRAIDEAAERVWADPAALARLLAETVTPLSLLWDVAAALYPDDTTADPEPTVEEWEAAIRAGRLAALPEDVRARLERYVRERCAERRGL